MNMLRTLLRAIWTICQKDLRVWLRHPSNVAITVLPALALLAVSALSAGAVGHSPVALVTLDHGVRGQQMAQIIHRADLFRVSDATTAQAQALYQNLDVVAILTILTIPATFTKAIDAHAPVHIEVQINNLNADFTNDIRRSIPDAITQFYHQQGARSPVQVTLSEHNLRRQDIQLFQYSAMPLLVLLLVVSGLVSSSLAAAGEWETRTIKELLLSPASSAAIILGKVLTGFVTTMALGVLVLGVGEVLGWVQPTGVYWLPVLLVLGLVALFSAGLGVALGALLQRIQPVSSAAIVISLYLFFLTGGTAVLAFDPGWLQTIATFVPLYYGRHALEMAIFYQSSDQLGRDLGVLTASALFAVGLGILAMRRGMAEARLR
jgi:ABC-type multidrug transport system permease subunit